MKQNKDWFSRFFKQLALIYKELCVARISKERSLKQTLLITVAIALIGLALNWQRVGLQNLPVRNDGHAVRSFEIAVNQVTCGTISSSVSSAAWRTTVRQIIIDNADVLNTRILDLPKLSAGSNEEYCKNTTPFLNNENSLMWMNAAILRLVPNITINGLGFLLTGLKLFCSIVFVFYLLRIGISPIISLATLVIGINIIALMYETHYYSLYPFLMPFSVFLVSALGLSLSFGVHRRIGATLAVLTAIGLFGAFFKNLRSSYYPVILACLLIYAVFCAIDLRLEPILPRIRKFLLPGLAVLCFLCGTAAFNTVFVKPLENRNIKSSFSYHVIAHPLVLSLAIPESNLSNREGIKWSDAQGEVLAKRIDKNATYLTPAYEKALFTYYVKLWLYYPNEMFDIYKNKLAIAGYDVLQSFRSEFAGSGLRALIVNTLYFPMILLPNGGTYLLLFISISIAGILSLRFINLGAAFALTALSSMGALLVLESTLIYPYLVLTYHNFLLFWIFCVNLIFYQFVLNSIPWLSQKAVQLVQRPKIA